MKKYLFKAVKLVVAVLMMLAIFPTSIYANEEPDFTKDWIKFNNGSYYYFNNELTEDDYATILQNYGYSKASVDDFSIVKSEYHYVDSEIEQFTKSKYYNQNLALGIAGNFHIVAFDTATLSSHTNGNVLCNNLVANSNYGTNGYNEISAYIANDYKTVTATNGSKQSNALVLGSTAKLSLEDNGNAFGVNGTKLDCPKIVYKDSENTKYIDINKVKEQVVATSSGLAARPNTTNLKYEKTDNLTVLSLTDPDGVATINMKGSDLSFTDLHFVGFQSGHNGTIIVNVDCQKSDVTLPERALVYIDGKQQGTGEVTDFSAGKVIWNFTNCSGTTITAKQMTGTIIAPEATVLLSQNINGTIIANNTKNTAETHRTDFTGKINNDVVTFNVSKAFKDDNWPVGTTYDVSITAKDGAPLPTTTSVTLTDSDNTKQLDPITYNYDSSYDGKTIDYSYTISETKGDVENVKYTDTAYLVKVSVEYVTEQGTGNRSATVTKTQYSLDNGNTWNDFNNNTDTLKFVNTYEKPSSSATLSVHKTVEGDTAPAETYNFTLVADTENAPMPESTSASCSADANASFGSIQYGPDDAGKNYIYKISEAAGTTLGMSYSSEVKYAKVAISADGKTATVTYGDSKDSIEATEVPTITNTYDRPESSATLSVKKTVSGTGAPAETFNFSLVADTENAPMPENKSASCAAEATASFGSIQYEPKDAGKSYIYKISETNPVNPTLGMTYSTDVKYAKVNISADGKTATVTYGDSKDSIEETTVPTITNTYEMQVGNLIIEKSFDGDNITDEDKANLKFEITYPDGSKNIVAYSDFTDGKYELVDVPSGEYTVHEVNAEIEGYDVTVTTTVNKTETEKVTVGTATTSTISIKDSYTKRPETPETPDKPNTPETPDRPQTPNTGDQTNAPLAAGVLGMSLILAGFVLVYKKKYSA